MPKGQILLSFPAAMRTTHISLTDIARYKSDAPDDGIKNWMRNRDTIEFLSYGSNSTI